MLHTEDEHEDETYAIRVKPNYPTRQGDWVKLNKMTEKARKCAKCNKSLIDDPNLVLHRFPKPSTSPFAIRRSTAWAKFCFPEEHCDTLEFHKTLYSSHKMLCSSHFTKSCFGSNNSNKLTLHRYAVPTKPPPSDAMTTSNSETDTDEHVALDERSGLFSFRRPKEFQNIKVGGADVQTVKYKSLFNSQINLGETQKSAKIDQLTADDDSEHYDDDIIFNEPMELRTYSQPPPKKTRKLFKAKTNQNRLKTLLDKLPLGPGINEHLYDALKDIAQGSTPLENEYSLLFDEMSVRKSVSFNSESDQLNYITGNGSENNTDSHVARHAVVFMISKIWKKVKQPVAYYLSKERVTAEGLAAMIIEVLQACFRAGIRIAATVCDIAWVNRNALRLLGVSTDRPYFTYETHEIVALYDTPNLVNRFRNMFMKYDIKCNIDLNIACDGDPIANVAKWSHIKQFYGIDSCDPLFVFAPALTKKHLDPKKQKTNFELAAQVLSHSVAAGIYAKATQGRMPLEALATVKLIENMDQLIDSLNADSPSVTRGKKFLRNFSNRSSHIEYFEGTMIPFFKNCEFIGVRSRPPSLDGWIQTMTGVKRLWQNLKRKHPSIGSLPTRRLQCYKML